MTVVPRGVACCTVSVGVGGTAVAVAGGCGGAVTVTVGASGRDAACVAGWRATVLVGTLVAGGGAVAVAGGSVAVAGGGSSLWAS